MVPRNMCSQWKKKPQNTLGNKLLRVSYSKSKIRHTDYKHWIYQKQIDVFNMFKEIKTASNYENVTKL